MNSELENALRQAQTNTKIAYAIAECSALELKERTSDTTQLIEDFMRFVEQKRDKITSLFTVSERKILERLNECYVALIMTYSTP
ncbi:MAG: hypothetical protein QMD21_07570 [Candidatus Thermoplasmatota archaeon]|nr:hypothetical protein [Candidatus Thermoplasmatota archaeon]